MRVFRSTLATVCTLVIAISLGQVARAQSTDPVTNCIAQWTTYCSAECATSKCVSNCTTQAQSMCRKDIAAPQNVFSGPVTATPVQCPSGLPSPLTCSSPSPITLDALTDTTSCSAINGTVAQKGMYGGNVTIYVVCPAGTPIGNPGQITSTTIIGQAATSALDGSFGMVLVNSCGGPTGCYGLIGVTPPTGADPGWNTCTSAACPSPKQ